MTIGNNTNRSTPMVLINNDGLIDTQQSSPVVTMQPRQMNFVSVSAGCEMLRTDCMNLVSNPLTCKIATGVLAGGAMGAVGGAAVSSFCALNMTKSLLVGYMTGTATGGVWGCVAQKAHDMHWSASIDQDVAEAVTGMTIPSDAPTADDIEEVDVEEVDVEEIAEPQTDVSDSACLIPKEEKSTAFKKNLELAKERFFE